MRIGVTRRILKEGPGALKRIEKIVFKGSRGDWCQMVLTYSFLDQ
jgi:hypothetical protein